MGKRGPKPKFKLVAQDYHLAPLPVAPPPPEDFNAAARRLWVHTAQLLNRMGVLTEADMMALENLVRWRIEEAKMTRRIEKDGLMVKGRERTFVRNPLLSSRAELRRQISAMMDKFGLTPESRVKFKSVPNTIDTKASVVDELLNS